MKYVYNRVMRQEKAFKQKDDSDNDNDNEENK